jgi:hypothetical protein
VAIRTTAELVTGIITLDDEDDDLTPFIDVANMLVDAVCVNDSEGEPFGYTDAELERIERWLSAHFYAVYRPRAFLSQVETLREQIESKVSLKLDVTRYGQQAMLLDYHGGLAALNNGLNEVTKNFPGATGRKPRIYWLGKKDP